MGSIMPRANRHSIAGQVWHLTHRCHKREWLLKFSRDRQRWIHWLFKARQRYGLCVLNYLVTSNHIHLLVHDQGRKEIAKSMQLVAGRTAQEYNQRKNRRGAFWEDRYHATAVQTDSHLASCMTYIDLNMVRAGVAQHPLEWTHCGMYELMYPPMRKNRLDTAALQQMFDQPSVDALKKLLISRSRIKQASGPLGREGIWSEAVMVGDESFVRSQQQMLKTRYPGLDVVDEQDDNFSLRELPGGYSKHFLAI